MTRVKICGITTPTDRDAAVAAGAHALGFTVNVTVDTPRETTQSTAKSLIDDTPPFVTTVLVTMPKTPDDAITLATNLNPDAIQVHGTLTPSQLTEVITSCSQDLLVAVDPTDPDAAHDYATVADALLLDTPRERGGGGTGQPHDWTTSRNLQTELELPVILAGGLTPENVADAIRTVNPYGVDVASGVESTGGHKDHQKVRDFITNATHATEAPPQ